MDRLYEIGLNEEDNRAFGVGLQPRGAPATGGSYDRVLYLERCMKQLLGLYKQLATENRTLQEQKQSLREELHDRENDLAAKDKQLGEIYNDLTASRERNRLFESKHESIVRRYQQQLGRRESRIKQLSSVVKEAIDWIDNHESFSVADEDLIGRFRSFGLESGYVSPNDRSRSISPLRPLESLTARGSQLPPSPNIEEEELEAREREWEWELERSREIASVQSSGGGSGGRRRSPPRRMR